MNNPVAGTMPRLVPETGPEISLENQANVYDFFKNQKISERIANFAHNVFRVIYAPEVEFIGDAENQIKEHFDQGKTVILASTHGLLDDPFVLASIAKREKVLRPLVGNTVIPAKEAIFKMTKSPLVNKLMRVVLDNFIALPTFRDRDYPLDDMDEEEKTHTNQLLREANSTLIDQCVDRLDDGNNLAIFPEGHRGENPDEIQPLKTGISRMAQRTKRKDDIVIVPLSIRYTHERHLNKKEGENSLMFAMRSLKNLLKRRKPQVAIGEVIETLDSEDGLLYMVQHGLQGCLDRTIQMAA